MPEEEYSEEKTLSGRAWVLSTKARDLQEIDSIFFDCDGVLVDVRDSYDSTIIETVRLLAEGLMGLMLPESMPTRRSILELKRSGGFNNDWFVSYALLLGIYAYFPGRTSEDVPEAISTKERERILSDRIKRSRTPRSLSPGTSDTWRLVDEAVVKLAGKADHTGIHSLMKTLEEEGRGSNVNAVKRLLGYPVEASIVGRVFDEMFYGPQLFRDKFKTESKFYKGTGFVELEKPSISEETLAKLADRIGKERLGIVSGRDHASAQKTLGELIKSFPAKNLLFLLVDPDHKGRRSDISKPLLNKPDPEILLMAALGLDRFKRLLYVGDSAEDLIMVRRANQICPSFLFAGIYGLTSFKEEMQSYFRENGADAVLASVNDLPELLDAIGGSKP